MSAMMDRMDPYPETHADSYEAVWTAWRALMQARRDGAVTEAEYRRATAELRRRLDQLPEGAPELRQQPEPEELDAPAVHPRRVAPPQERNPTREPASAMQDWPGLASALVIVTLAAVLAAALGYAIVVLTS